MRERDVILDATGSLLARIEQLEAALDAAHNRADLASEAADMLADSVREAEAKVAEWQKLHAMECHTRNAAGAKLARVEGAREALTRLTRYMPPDVMIDQQTIKNVRDREYPVSLAQGAK